jgi:hypothetical protein
MEALKNRFESATSKLVSLEHSPKYQNAREVQRANKSENCKKQRLACTPSADPVLLDRLFVSPKFVEENILEPTAH